MSKTILITGGAGFIAHHVIDTILMTTDWNIVTLDRLDYSGNLNRLHEVILKHSPITYRRIKVIYHDLKAEINSQLSAAIGKVDYIAHLAAGSHVDRSISNPLEFVMDNVVGTCNILNFARTVDGLRRFVYFSTDEVFGPAHNQIKFDEYARYNSTNPYSASKAGGEELVVAFQNTYGIPAYITHTMNVFGERQHPEKFIPQCISNIIKGTPVTIHTDPTKTIIGSRFYIHAADVADALVLLLQANDDKMSPPPSGIKIQKFNIVGHEEWTNLDVATIIADAVGKGLVYDFVDYHSSRPGHDLRYALDGNRILNQIGWQPRPAKQRLEQVVQWTLKNKQWLNI